MQAPIYILNHNTVKSYNGLNFIEIVEVTFICNRLSVDIAISQQ